jgi:hypothetical protein
VHSALAVNSFFFFRCTKNKLYKHIHGYMLH